MFPANLYAPAISASLFIKSSDVISSPFSSAFVVFVSSVVWFAACSSGLAGTLSLFVPNIITQVNIIATSKAINITNATNGIPFFLYIVHSPLL